MIKFNGFKNDDTRQILTKALGLLKQAGVESPNDYHQLVTCDMKPHDVRDVILRKMTPRLQKLIKTDSIRAYRAYHSLLDGFERDTFGATVKEFDEDPDNTYKIYADYCAAKKAA